MKKSPLALVRDGLFTLNRTRVLNITGIYKYKNKGEIEILNFDKNDPHLDASDLRVINYM
jgi:hypothetical protein